METVPAETEPEVVTEPDPRTPWQIKFEDRFTDEVVVTENSYTSQEVSVTLKRFPQPWKTGWSPILWQISIIAGIENFKTYIAYDEFIYFAESGLYTQSTEAEDAAE